MPASIFNGAISFGLVSIPITVLSATEDHSVRFRRIHTPDNGLVRNRYWCDAEDREVTFGAPPPARCRRARALSSAWAPASRATPHQASWALNETQDGPAGPGGPGGGPR
ncbi:hypothetical protein ACWDMZ_41760, partial [Streptomyces sp. NPDC000994]